MLTQAYIHTRSALHKCAQNDAIKCINTAAVYLLALAVCHLPIIIIHNGLNDVCNEWLPDSCHRAEELCYQPPTSGNEFVSCFCLSAGYQRYVRVWVNTCVNINISADGESYEYDINHRLHLCQTEILRFCKLTCGK